MGAIAWRGMLFILPAPIFFGLTVRGLGLRAGARSSPRFIASFASPAHEALLWRSCWRRR